MNDRPDHIVCKYLFPDDYNPKYINGAFGGISPRGEIVINFYLERMALPTKQSFLIEGDTIGEEIVDKREPEDHKYSFVRVIENGIILDYKNAKEIHRWLGEHLRQLEEKIDK